MENIMTSAQHKTAFEDARRGIKITLLFALFALSLFLIVVLVYLMQSILFDFDIPAKVVGWGAGVFVWSLIACASSYEEFMEIIQTPYLDHGLICKLDGTHSYYDDLMWDFARLIYRKSLDRFA